MADNKKNYTYILECRDHSLYTGWTNDIRQRLKKHNDKKGAKYTRCRTPVRLVYLEVFPTKREAMQREAAIKKLSRREKQELIERKIKLKKYTAVRKLTENPFLNMYEMDAITQSGKPFHYYFASRNTEEHLKINTHTLEPEGIVIYGILKEEKERIVLLRQYRYPLDDYLYELPAGLVDEGETAVQAAIREMKEETGLSFCAYEGGSQAFRRPFFMAQGLTDEASAAVFGYAEGKRGKASPEDSEEIEVILADKEEAKRILGEEKVSLRAAYLLMQFIHSDPREPFAFLSL